MTNFIEIPASKKSLSLKRPLFGVGINDADYITQPKINSKKLVCPYYRVWVNMLQRCYSDEYQSRQPTYIGCSVCIDWLVFSNFKAWMINQDWKEKCLDKDLLIQGNKIYSPKFCLFVTRAINNLLIDNRAVKGKYKQGVHFHKSSQSFVSEISINGKSKHLGSFSTPEEASNKYLSTKYDLINEMALQQEEPLKSALLSYVIK